MPKPKPQTKYWIKVIETATYEMEASSSDPKEAVKEVRDKFLAMDAESQQVYCTGITERMFVTEDGEAYDDDEFLMDNE